MRGREEVERKVEELVSPILEDMGLELYEVSFHPAGNRSVLRVFIDRPEGGITLTECAEVSRELSAVLDVEDPIPSSYTLEVSSPGATRRLRNERDFERAVGKLVLVETVEAVDGKRRFVGRLVAFESGVATIEVRKRAKKGMRPKVDKLVDIPYEQVKFARLELDIDEVLGGKQ